MPVLTEYSTSSVQAYSQHSTFLPSDHSSTKLQKVGQHNVALGLLSRSIGRSAPDFVSYLFPCMLLRQGHIVTILSK